MEQSVQLLHPVCIGSSEGIGSTKVIVVDSTKAGQVTVTAIVAVWHSSTDDDKQIHKQLHELAETLEDTHNTDMNI